MPRSVVCETWNLSRAFVTDTDTAIARTLARSVLHRWHNRPRTSETASRSPVSSCSSSRFRLLFAYGQQRRITPNGGPNTVARKPNGSTSVAAASRSARSANACAGCLALVRGPTRSANACAGCFAIARGSAASANTCVGCLALVRGPTRSANACAGCLAVVRGSAGSANACVGCLALVRGPTRSAKACAGCFAIARGSAASADACAGCLAVVRGSAGSANACAGYLAAARRSAGSANACVGPAPRALDRSVPRPTQTQRDQTQHALATPRPRHLPIGPSLVPDRYSPTLIAKPPAITAP